MPDTPQSVDPVDFLVLHTDGRITADVRRPGESINTAIRRHIPDLGTQGLGRLRMWFSDTFTPDLPDNHLADQVITRLGYRHIDGWRGPVAISMEDQYDHTPPLPVTVLDTITEISRTSPTT
ncbi:hypothetical protein ACWDUL_20995 [Nocardia niigatensis]